MSDSREQLIRTHMERMRKIAEADRQRMHDLAELNTLAIYLGSAGKDPSKKLDPRVTELVSKGISGGKISEGTG